MSPPPTVIIGGGVAGLAAAIRLQELERRFVLLEASDRVGGRVKTDVIEGFQIDRGFQVLLTAYPACQRLLDYKSLDLRAFEPGSLIRIGGRFRRLGDPWRRPGSIPAAVFNPVGSIGDKLRLARLRSQSLRGTLEDLYGRPQTSTIDRLRDDGFSERIIDQFFRPFLGGVYLDESLATPSRMLEFVFRMFASGDIVLPAAGIEAIPQQMVARLPPGSVRTGCTVTGVDFGESEHTIDSGGEPLRAAAVIMATESNAAARLLGRPQTATSWSSTVNLCYAADRSPRRDRLLILRGDEPGPIQTACVPSAIAPPYAPADKALISVSVGPDAEDVDGINDGSFEDPVRKQLRRWFGPEVDDWRLLQINRVPYGLPRLDLDVILRPAADPQIRRLYHAGDRHQSPSLQAAMDTGIRAADAVARDLS